MNPKQNLTLSVVVPCASVHVHCLPDLLALFSRQTCPPDEVVISISGMRQWSPPAKRFPFTLRCLVDQAPALAGANRNRAARASKGDVLIYHDADDLPHPQKIEIVRTIFERTNTDHLMHGFLHLKKKVAAAEWSNLRFEVGTSLQRASYRIYDFERTRPNGKQILHNGNISTTRRVFERVQWDEGLKRGQDVHYNREVAKSFPSTMAVILDQLIAYREYLSSKTPSPRRPR